MIEKNPGSTGTNKKSDGFGPRPTLPKVKTKSVAYRCAL